MVYVEEHEKRSMLLDLLSNKEENGLTLIFVETKRGADALDEFLYNNGFPVTSIHGDRDQRSREEGALSRRERAMRNPAHGADAYSALLFWQFPLLALRSFREHRTPYLVATAVAARGLDIPNVTQVINYDLPSDVDDYVHRIGRTGRAGNVGTATSFFTPNNRNVAAQLATLLREANQEVPSWLEAMASDGWRGSSRRGGGGGSGSSYRGGGGGSGSFRSGGGSSGSWDSAPRPAPAAGGRGGSAFGARDARQDAKKDSKPAAAPKDPYRIMDPYMFMGGGGGGGGNYSAWD